MSETFIKIIDAALLPAAIAIVTKLFSVVLLLNIFGIPWSFSTNSESLFNISENIPSKYLVEIISYSDLITYIVIAIGFSTRLIQAIFFHRTHIKPSLIIKLAQKNMLSLIQGSYEIYNKAFVWLIFLWLINVIILINTLNNVTHFWIFLVCTISTIVLTSSLLHDVKSEAKAIIEEYSNKISAYKK